jgi:hypothetical protein
MEKQFIHLCCIGNLEEVKSLLTKNPTINFSAFEQSFRYACRFGNL